MEIEQKINASMKADIDLSIGPSCEQLIISKTVNVLQGFMLELALGNTKYKSLHNLTEQVEHQYHERFLVELIQNAHDALLPRHKPTTHRRIEIQLQKEDGEHGALYIANDGIPFNSSNFNSLSELGQSDKDPEESIGNKGIGFRSVLEITDSPEIYSRKQPDSKVFDGFCFRFHPGIIQKFEQPILSLLNGNKDTLCPYSQNEKLLPGGNELYSKLLDNCDQKEKTWLREELKYLSPYLFPEPIQVENMIVKDFEYDGYATVIRLPFIDEKSYQSALKKLSELPDDMILFLDRVEVFKLVANKHVRILERNEEDLENDPEHGKAILLSIKNMEGLFLNDQLKEYWLWQEVYGGKENPEQLKKVKETVAELPGKWPNLSKAKASFAVRVDEMPEQGCLNIYLPTKMTSGCHAHFSAPFYGDINRTAVNFGKDYNELLLNIIASKVVKVIKNFLSGKGVMEAAAIIDLISAEKTEEGSNWWNYLESAGENLGIDFREDFLCLTDQGWKSLKETRSLPDINQFKLFTDSLLRQHTQTPIIVNKLFSRKLQLVQIYENLGFDCHIDKINLADTVETIAEELHKNGGVDWNYFWNDIMQIFTDSADPLISKKILLGTDNHLHASSGETKVFFRQVYTAYDNGTMPGKTIEDIPKELNNFIAFLHKDITTHLSGDSGGLRATPVQRYLADNNLVETFQIQEIFQVVLLRNTPKDFPVTYSDSRSALCQAIFQWGLWLAYSWIEQGKGENLIRLLGALPAPCIGGWYQLSTTSFGTGWGNTVGLTLNDYLLSMNSPACMKALNKILLPPDNPYWEAKGEIHQDTLRKAGVYDGLRLFEVEPEEWESTFNIAGWQQKVSLPSQQPPSVSEHFWQKYSDYISKKLEPYFGGSFKYNVQGFFLFPGFDDFYNSREKSKFLLTELILASITSWSKNQVWKCTVLMKDGGQTHSFTPPSPLFFFLENERWIYDKDENQIIAFYPSERWYINTNTLSGRIKQFSHLKPYPTTIRKLLDDSQTLVEELQELGMPAFNNTENVSDTRLLDSLAKAITDHDTDIVNQNVFLGQLREAWRQFYPVENGSFPRKLIVRFGRRLTVLTPSSENKPFLPNDSPAVHDGLELAKVPLIQIDSKEAKRLQKYFADNFSADVHLASALKMLPVINGESVNWPKDAGTTLYENDLEWLAPVILAVFAFAGEQSYGTATGTFTEAIEHLHDLRVHWVNDLALGLWQGERCITNVPIEQSAIKIPKKRAIISIKGNKQSLYNLSGVLSNIVNRNDLEIPLKLVLNKFEDGSPELDEIISALAELRISKEQFDEVQQLWLGEISWTIRLITPILYILDPEIDLRFISNLNSSDELEKFLAKISFTHFTTEQLLSEIQKAGSLKKIGRWLYEKIGDQAQLKKFNDILLKLNLPLVKNKLAEEEFKDHLHCMQPSLHAIARRILLSADAPESFLTITEQLRNVNFPKQFEMDMWNVEFKSTAFEVVKVLDILGASQQEIFAVRTSNNLAKLEESLKILGLKINEDSYNMHSLNCKAYRNSLSFFLKIAISWCLKSGTSFNGWSQQIIRKTDSLIEELDPFGYLELWTKKRCFMEIQQSNFPSMPAVFKNQLLLAKGLEQLTSSLGITEGDINSAEDDLVEHKQIQEREKRLVEIGGKKFDSHSENLGDLWDHMEENIPDENILPLKLNRSKPLQDLLSRKTKGHGKSGGNGTRNTHPRMTQSMKNLIGLAGEIMVYKSLEKEFGDSIVNSSCWVSENARYKFPGIKDVSDSKGCDFILKVRGKTYYIEVKATQGDNTTFELGSSEVRLAIDVARNSKKKKFIILHVLNTLSNSPRIRTLPNPYHKNGLNKYTITNQGLRMAYKVMT